MEPSIPLNRGSLNVYRHAFTCNCPNNGKAIGYVLMLYSRTQVMVEDIASACTVAEQFHEPLADYLAELLGSLTVLYAEHHGTEICTVRGSL